MMPRNAVARNLSLSRPESSHRPVRSSQGRGQPGQGQTPALAVRDQSPAGRGSEDRDQGYAGDDEGGAGEAAWAYGFLQHRRGEDDRDDDA